MSLLRDGRYHQANNDRWRSALADLDGSGSGRESVDFLGGEYLPARGHGDHSELSAIIGDRLLRVGAIHARER